VPVCWHRAHTHCTAHVALPPATRTTLRTHCDRTINLTTAPTHHRTPPALPHAHCTHRDSHTPRTFEHTPTPTRTPPTRPRTPPTATLPPACTHAYLHLTHTHYCMAVRWFAALHWLPAIGCVHTTLHTHTLPTHAHLPHTPHARATPTYTTPHTGMHIHADILPLPPHTHCPLHMPATHTLHTHTHCILSAEYSALCCSTDITRQRLRIKPARTYKLRIAAPPPPATLRTFCYAHGIPRLPVRALALRAPPLPAAALRGLSPRLPFHLLALCPCRPFFLLLTARSAHTRSTAAWLHHTHRTTHLPLHTAATTLPACTPLPFARTTALCRCAPAFLHTCHTATHCILQTFCVFCTPTTHRFTYHYTHLWDTHHTPAIPHTGLHTYLWDFAHTNPLPPSNNWERTVRVTTWLPCQGTGGTGSPRSLPHPTLRLPCLRGDGRAKWRWC